MSAGIGRHKELTLDEMQARALYVDGRLFDEGWFEGTADTDSRSRSLVASLIVLADVLHDVEKQLARLGHVVESRS